MVDMITLVVIINEKSKDHLGGGKSVIYVPNGKILSPKNHITNQSE